MENIDLDNPEFQNLWKLINYTDNSVFLTGKAGTGKSTFLKYITQHTRKKYVVLAPTGIAAVNVGGMTLHSFFGLPFKPLTPDDPEFDLRRLRKRMMYSKPKQKLIKALELVIIDEISMVRADIIDFIDKLLRVYGGNMREPFGGKQLLFVGDLFQLEPVITPDTREILRQYYPNMLFFGARVFQQMSMVPIELTKVYRQNDTSFIALLDRIRMGVSTQDDIALLNSRLDATETTLAPSDKMVMTLATRRDRVDSINERHLEALDAPEVIYTGEISGDFPENSLPTPIDLHLKVGAQVVFIKNDSEHRWVNGTIARVVEAGKAHLRVETENGEEYEVYPDIWENVRYSFDERTNKVDEQVIGTYRQYPIRLAWALTIHKSQGLTFSNVDIDLGHGAFSSGQTYVALSRCQSFDGLTLRSTIAPRDVFINPLVTDFSHSFNNPALMERALERAKADDCYKRASEKLEKEKIGEAFDLFVEAMRARSELSNEAAMRLVRSKLVRMSRIKEQLSELEGRIKTYQARFDELAAEYVSMGYDCLDSGYDLAPALANFEKALSLSPENIAALDGKVRALTAMGDKKEANKVKALIRKIKKQES